MNFSDASDRIDTNVIQISLARKNQHFPSKQKNGDDHGEMREQKQSENSGAPNVMHASVIQISSSRNEHFHPNAKDDEHGEMLGGQNQKKQKKKQAIFCIPTGHRNSFGAVLICN